MNREDPSSRRLAKHLALLGCVVGLLCIAARGPAQSRITRPQNPSNSNNSSNRQRVATLRSSDSPDGSRVALTANQSLSDYEAYRRGDRFYVKIPPADVPRPEVVRGRAFADVKVQRSVDSTVVSFRLQPGATAHVEQRGNKLDVVFTMPGAKSSSGREVARNDAGPAPPENRRRPATNANNSRAGNSNAATNKNANAASRQTATAKPSPTPKASPSPSPATALVKPSPSAQPTKPLTSAQTRVSPSPSPTAATLAPAQGDFWNRFKERARYWLLVAQLNPVPVGIGVAVLLLLIGLLILQRRRAKATRRARTRKSFAKGERAATPASVAAEAGDVASASAADAALAGTTVAAAAMASEAKQPPADDGRHERAARVSEEVKKMMSGSEYDQSIVASNDRSTRQLVGAELLSALVGRNVERRERARDAFMRHGYFDDATRDLRVGESANERAAAARRLSFVRDREATPHLIAALDDSSPDVRRASVEALMDVRDPSAIAPLNSLMQTETDRKVPRSLIKHAIEACATTAPDELAPTPAVSSFPAPAAASAETEREVIEI